MVPTFKGVGLRCDTFACRDHRMMTSYIKGTGVQVTVLPALQYHVSAPNTSIYGFKAEVQQTFHSHASEVMRINLLAMKLHGQHGPTSQKRTTCS